MSVRPSNQQLRVLFLTYELPPLGGGVANAADNLIREFGSFRGLELTVITASLRNKWEVHQPRPGLMIYQVPVGRKTAQTLQRQKVANVLCFFFNSWRMLRALSQRNDYDLAHYFGYLGAMTGYVFRRYKFILSLRGVEVPGFNPRFKFFYPVLRLLSRPAWRLAAAVTCPSRGLADLASETEQSIAYKVIPNGVDTKLFKPAAKKLPVFTVTTGGILFGVKKGLGVLLTAFADFHRDFPDTQLALIGSGDLEVKLQAQAEELGLGPAVKFLGRRSKREIAWVLARSHVYCLPSINEGMSNSTLEGAAAGLPLVLTPVGGADELLTNNGILIPFNDPVALAKSLRKLYKNPTLRTVMGQRSRRLAKRFSWEKAAKAYYQIYRQVGGKNGVVADN